MAKWKQKEQWEQCGFNLVLLMALFSCVSTAAMSVAIVLSALCVLGQRCFCGQWPRIERQTVYVACAYLVLYFIVAALSINPKESFHEYFGEAYRFFPFFFATAYVRAEKQVRDVLLGLAASVFVNNCVALWQFFLPFLQQGQWVRVKGTISTINSYGNTLAMVMPLLVFGFLHSRASLRMKYFFAVTFLVSFVMMVICRTRSGWVAFLGTMLTAALLDAQLRRYCVRILGGCACIFLLLSFFHASFLKNDVVSIADMTSNRSNLERLYMWRGAMEIWKDYPIHGVGQDMYGAVYASEDSKYRLPQARPFGNPHSIFFQVLSEGGVIGLFASAGLHLYFLFGLWKMHRKQKPLMVMSYGMAGILMATAIGIGGMFDAGMDHVGVARMYWLIMGTLFAGANIMSGKNTLGQSKL